MATTYHTEIQQLYVAYFNRPADPAGLAFWETVLEGNGGDTAVISAEFAKSAEYTTEYSDTTNTGVVTKVYQNLFGHAPDAAGLAFWVKALNDRAMTVDTMVTEISKGAQGTDKVAFDSKVVVATAFTNALDTEAEATGYNSEDAQAAAKTLLSGIKTEAQATAAIVPATLDASVAAVIKAGVPFTLATGLTALGAAEDAKADFLEAFGEANDIKNADDADVADAVTAAKTALAGMIDDADFAGASAGVQAAMIADQIETNDDTLEAANKALTTAQEAVAKVKGLGAAIAAAASAEIAVEEAQEAEIDASLAALNAENVFKARNATTATTTGSVATDDLVIKNTDGDTIATMVDGELVVADDVDAADYTGLAALVAAVESDSNAEADVVAAMDASMFATLQAELLDLESATVRTGAFTFTLTEDDVADTDKPTYDEIVDELSALTAASVTADAAVAAADPLSAGYGALVTAANDARTALNDFRGEITQFNLDNDTKLADAVTRAEEGTLSQAQADVADVTGLAAAIAAKAELDAATLAQTAADAEFEEASEDFDAAYPALFINADGTVGTTAGADDVVTLNADDELEVAAGITETTNPGVTDYIDAGNAALAAEAAVTAAALTVPETTLLTNNAAIVTALEVAQANAESSVAATRAAALGTEGAQNAIEDLTDAQEALEEAQAAADQLESLDDAIEEAQAAFEDNDYNAPTMLGVSAFGTTGSDIFVATDVNSTIANFGRSGDDVLYVGTGYTLNASDDLDDGVNATLEVFFTQSGNNTIVTVETKAYGSDSGDVQTITLTGVDAEDLTFTNGIITI